MNFNFRAALDEYDRLVRSRRDEIQTLEKDLQQLEREREALHAAGERLGELASNSGLGAEGNEEWKKLGRSDAVERVMREADGPLANNEIRARLLAVGRDDTTNYVAAALQNLKKHERAFPMGRGEWCLGPRSLLGDQPEVNPP